VPQKLKNAARTRLCAKTSDKTKVISHGKYSSACAQGNSQRTETDSPQGKVKPQKSLYLEREKSFSSGKLFYIHLKLGNPPSSSALAPINTS